MSAVYVVMVENVSHRFYDCKYIMVFWQDFNVYCGQKLKTVNKESIFLGEDDELLCTLIFGAKLYIHKCYVRGLNLPHFVITSQT